MQANRILFATDFSPASEGALALAVSLARDSGGKLFLLHAAEPLAIYSDVPSTGVTKAEVAQLQASLDALPTEGLSDVERKVVVGLAAEQIVAFAKREHADLIVMGTHGRSGFSRLLMGSVAETVLRSASCPVLTLKGLAPVTTHH